MAKLTPTRAANSGLSLIPILVLLLIPAFVLSLPIAILLIIGMIPSYAAMIYDRTPQKNITTCVGLLNLCGLMPFALKIWQEKISLAQTLLMLTKLENWLLILLATAFGWILIFMTPAMVRLVYTMRGRQRINDLKQRYALLQKDWRGAIPDLREKPSSDAEITVPTGHQGSA